MVLRDGGRFTEFGSEVNAELTEYNNHSAPGSFHSVGAEEQNGASISSTANQTFNVGAPPTAISATGFQVFPTPWAAKRCAQRTRRKKKKIAAETRRRQKVRQPPVSLKESGERPCVGVTAPDQVRRIESGGP